MTELEEKLSEEEEELRYFTQNYLAAFQKVQIGQEGEWDMDTIRTSMCMKYLIARKT